MRVLVALAVLVAAEISVLVVVGQQIGLLGLVAVLIGSALLGGWALRREGRRAREALLDAVRRGRPAEAEVAGGMVVALAGVLLVVPGLLTTLGALVLLLPPIRRALARRAAAGAVRAGSARRGPSVTVIGATTGAGQDAGQHPARSTRDPRPFAGRTIEGHLVDRPDEDAGSVETSDTPSGRR
jgi:UPF0716 protein FxsA